MLECIHNMMEKINSIENKKIIKPFEGNWTLLQKERNIYNKPLYIQILRTLEEELSQKEDIQYEKNNIEVILKKYYKNEDKEAVRNIIENFETFVDSVYSKTGYIESKELYKTPENLGVYSRGETYVFRDAVTKNENGDRVPISDKQKDIIDAHEKTHAMYEILPNEIRDKIKQPFSGRLDGYKDKHQSDEILARMAQIKNFLGFSSNEVFTKEHLDFIRRNYVDNTGLDNTMKSFLDKIENENLFISNMNTVPC